MAIRKLQLLTTLSGLIFCLIVFGPRVYAATVEEQLDQLNRMPEKGRLELLEKEARREGELIWYAAMASDRAGELIKVFEAKYPYLKVRFQPGGAGRQLEQLLVEHRTKKHRADIINTRRSYVAVMAKAGAVARYRTPLRAALRDGFTDKEGCINGIYAQPRVFLFNNQAVARDKAPQSFDDLLESRWKDKLGMDNTDYDWLASIMDYYGAPKGSNTPASWPSSSLTSGAADVVSAARSGRRVSHGYRCVPRRSDADAQCQSAGGFYLLRTLRGGEDADHGFNIRRRAPSPLGGVVRRFSVVQGGAGFAGQLGALGEPQGHQLFRRCEGQKSRSLSPSGMTSSPS